jgi:hypothetical protein
MAPHRRHHLRNLLWSNQRTLKDPTGKAFGTDRFAAGQNYRGQVSIRGARFEYKAAAEGEPGNQRDLVWGVGYYK